MWMKKNFVFAMDLTVVLPSFEKEKHEHRHT